RRQRALDEPSLFGKLVSYALLGFWALVVLFPLYWLLITSVKLPIDVNEGPFYLPFLDFQPSLDAWRYLFGELLEDTLRPYRNTVVVALVSSVLALAIGSLAAYALVRIRYRPRLGTIGLFILGILVALLAVTLLGAPWPVALAAGLALFALLAPTLRRR